MDNLGVRQRRIYLLHFLRRRMAYPEHKRRVREHAEARAAHIVLIALVGRQAEMEALNRALEQARPATAMSLRRFVSDCKEAPSILGERLSRHSVVRSRQVGFHYLLQSAPRFLGSRSAELLLQRFRGSGKRFGDNLILGVEVPNRSRRE